MNKTGKHLTPMPEIDDLLKDVSSSPARKRPLFTRPLFITTAIILLCLAAVAVFSLYQILSPLKTSEQIIRIKPGQSTRSISQNLKDNHIIRSAFWFHVLIRVTHSDRQLKSGRYVFGGNYSLMQTVMRLKQGRSTLLHLTIPEGFSLYQVCKVMEKSGIAPYDTLMAIATNPTVVKRLTKQNYTTLEGFLYPETYAFDIDLRPEQIFGVMTRLFFQKVNSADIPITGADTFYRTLILASIVEQEAVVEDEKPLIAGVYLNRLHRNMKMESCPTVDYILEREGIHRKRLLYSDLKIDSPYNTYLHTGLPPTPICNPSISAIQAVLNPEVTDYLYFFADFNGRNVFSKTYAEHLARMKTEMHDKQ